MEKYSTFIERISFVKSNFHCDFVGGFRERNNMAFPNKTLGINNILEGKKEMDCLVGSIKARIHDSPGGIHLKMWVGFYIIFHDSYILFENDVIFSFVIWVDT